MQEGNKGNKKEQSRWLAGGLATFPSLARRLRIGEAGRKIEESNGCEQKKRGMMWRGEREEKDGLGDGKVRSIGVSILRYMDVDIIVEEKK